MIRDTSKNTSEVWRNMLSWLGGGNSKAIENQEKEGQQQLVETSFEQIQQLPANVNSYTKGEAAEQIYKSLGFEIVGPTEGDALFLDVKVVKGWRVEPTDHSMWSNLIDSNNNIRASIFYKAAFYDRDSFINPLQLRYWIRRDYQDDTAKNGFNQYVRVVDTKTDTILFERDGLVNSYKMSQNDMDKTCLKFLKKNYPKWEDPLAYWD